MDSAAQLWLQNAPRLALQPHADETSAYEHSVETTLVENEPPTLLNALLERTCNLQCRHCFFSEETSSGKASRDAGLTDILENLVRQLAAQHYPGRWSPAFVHEGRIVQPWHVELLARLQTVAPTVNYGLIDNGTYTKHLPRFKERNVTLDWIDISCDGTRENHNLQRDPIRNESYDDVLKGLSNARQLTRTKEKGGRVTSLMTLTALNYQDIPSVAQTVFTTDAITGLPLIDELHVSTINPVRPENHRISLQPEHLGAAFEDLQRVRNERNESIYFRIYHTPHLGMLANYVGAAAMREAFEHSTAHSHGIIVLPVKGVPVIYAPSSLWPAEGIFVDANGDQRVAYGQAHTLHQLQQPAHVHYTVQHLSASSDLALAHEANARHWMKYFAPKFFDKELEVLRAVYQS